MYKFHRKLIERVHLNGGFVKNTYLLRSWIRTHNLPTFLLQGHLFMPNCKVIMTFFSPVQYNGPRFEPRTLIFPGRRLDVVKVPGIEPRNFRRTKSKLNLTAATSRAGTTGPGRKRRKKGSSWKIKSSKKKFDPTETRGIRLSPLKGKTRPLSSTFVTWKINSILITLNLSELALNRSIGICWRGLLSKMVHFQLAAGQPQQVGHVHFYERQSSFKNT